MKRSVNWVYWHSFIPYVVAKRMKSTIAFSNKRQEKLYWT